jgi:glycosyltransferase involved in cell wall biosynthesis
VKLRVAFVSILPSPYQRDLFEALARREDLDLRVFYLEKRTPDSPWPDVPLRDYETILPGLCVTLAGARIHFNRPPALESFDVVVLNSLMAATAQWLMRAGLRGKRWVFWGEMLRGGRGGWKARLHHGLSAALARASAIVAIGSRAAADYTERFPGKPVRNIPYHCDLAAFADAARRECRAPTSARTTTFLFCGQMIRRKGVDVLLDAFVRLAGTAADVRLLLVGREADLPQLLERVPPPIRPLIEYAGFQAPDALPPFFARADAFVLPSRYDGWGVVVNQALGAALPILCSSEVGAAYDLVEEGVNGFRFPPDDAAALSVAMGKLATDSGLRQAFASASAAKAADWSPERGAQRWAEVLREVAP